jgi:hypothetical protein
MNSEWMWFTPLEIAFVVIRLIKYERLSASVKSNQAERRPVVLQQGAQRRGILWSWGVMSEIVQGKD